MQLDRTVLAGILPGEGARCAPVEIVTDIGDVRRLRRDWERALPAPADPMQHFGWVLAAAECFAPHGAARIFLRRGEGPLAAMSLVERGPARCLEALGVRELYEPTDFPAGEEAARLAVARAVAATGSPLFLERLPASSPWIAALRRAYRGRAWIRVAPAHGSPFVPLAGCADPESLLNARRRSDLRRARRRAAQMGEVTYEVLAPRSPAQLAAALADAYRVECSGWKGQGGSALACDALRGPFFRRYAAEASEAGMLRLCFLRIGRAAAAMQIALEAQRRFWLLKIGYDARFASCSPGSLLTAYTIGHAAREGLEAYEFLGCPEPWTRPWGARERPCVALRAYPFNARGAAMFARHLARALRRRVTARIPGDTP